MSAPVVAQVLRAVDQRRFWSRLSVLGDLGPAELDAARAALEKLPRRSRVDVPTLVDCVRAEVAERRAADAARRRAEANPFAYALTLMSTAQLEVVRDRLKAGDDVPAAMTAASKFEIGDDSLPPPRSRSLPRVRSRRARPETADDAVSAPIPARSPDPAAIPEDAGRPGRQPGTLPWVLAKDSDDEEEGTEA